MTSLGKRLCALLLTALLLLGLVPVSFADTYYVYTENGKTLNLRSVVDNSVIGHIPYGTKLETDNNLSTEKAAYVTYKGVSGYVKWEFLVKNPPKPRNTSSSSASQPPADFDPDSEDGWGDITIRVIGGNVAYRSSGEAFGAISYDEPVPLTVKADKKPAYWVINGVRYDFEPYIPSGFALDNAWQSMTIEAVPKGGKSETLLSKEEIQEARTDETLIVQTIRSKLCHLNAKDYGSGGWITQFDFTEDYTNRATKKKEQGGQMTFRVRATLNKNQKISYWLFDEAKLDFNTNVTQFVVRTLNTSKTYEPVISGSAAAEKPSPTERPSATVTRPTVTVAPTARPSNSTNTRPSATVAPTEAPSKVTRPGSGTAVRPTATPANSRPGSGTAVRPTATPANSRPGSGTAVRPTATPANSRPSTSNTRPSTAATEKPSGTRPSTSTNTRPTTAATEKPAYYSISCTNCTFSGFRYVDCTSGQVPEGTKLTFTVKNNASVAAWYINGAKLVLSRGGEPNTNKSITVTITKNTTVRCEYAGRR